MHPRDGSPIFVDEEEIDLAEQIYEKATRKKIALATTFCISYILNHWTTMRGVDLDHRLGLSFDFPHVNSEEEIVAAAEAALRQMTVFRQLSWAAKVRVQMIRRMYLGDAIETDEDLDSISSLIIR